MNLWVEGFPDSLQKIPKWMTEYPVLMNFTISYFSSSIDEKDSMKMIIHLEDNETCEQICDLLKYFQIQNTFLYDGGMTLEIWQGRKPI